MLVLEGVLSSTGKFLVVPESCRGNEQWCSARFVVVLVRFVKHVGLLESRSSKRVLLPFGPGRRCSALRLNALESSRRIEDSFYRKNI